jgi:iron(III) transport system permease protein
VVWLWGVPGPVVGLAIIALMNRPEFPLLIRLYDETIVPSVLACLAHSLPLATLILWSSFRSIPDELLEAAELEGAGWWQRLWLVVLPLRWPALVLAWGAAFVWSLGELDASELVAAPGVKPLSIHLFGLLHFGAQDQVAALCLALYIVMQIVTVCGWWLLRKMGSVAPRIPT